MIMHRIAQSQKKDGFDKQPLRDLAEPEVLKRLDCLYTIGNLHIAGDYLPQVPRALAMIGRGASPGHAVRIIVDDDIAEGLAEGRIKKTELRLQLTGYEKCMNRIVFEVNGKKLDLSKARTIKSKKHSCLVIDNPPIRKGENSVLLLLEGTSTPQSWPTLHSCEIFVKCSD